MMKPRKAKAESVRLTSYEAAAAVFAIEEMIAGRGLHDCDRLAMRRAVKKLRSLLRD